VDAIDTQIDLNAVFSIQANYTFTQTELTSGSFVGKEVPAIAKDRANIAITYMPIEPLLVYLESNYTGARYHTGDNANEFAKVDSLLVFNVNVIWQYRALELSGRINNLTNEHYAGLNGYSPRSDVGFYQYPQPERNYTASVIYRF
jgi:iron complex outermembrane recepter protein